MLEQVSKFPSFLKLNNTSLYVYTTLCLSIHLPIDTWVNSVFWLLRTMLLMDVISKDLFEVLLSVPLDSYPAVELLDPVGVLLLLFEELLCCFLKQLRHFTVPTSSAQGPQFLHFLANTCVVVVASSHPLGPRVVFHCGFDL